MSKMVDTRERTRGPRVFVNRDRYPQLVMDDHPKRNMDEPVNIQLEPEEALKVLLRAVNDPDANGDPPKPGWPGEESN